MDDTAFQATAPSRGTIPTQRVIDKTNEYLGRRDMAGAGRLLVYWLDEARALGDRRGELTVLNELIGLSRKTDRESDALRYAADALKLLTALDLETSTVAGTTYVNIATARYVFGAYDESLRMFERARAVYEARPDTDPSLLGGLYNNMGLTLTALRRWDEAMAAYSQALSCMERVPGGEPERAETCLNMANTLEYRYGTEAAEKRIWALLDEAERLLRTPGLRRDGYFAEVCRFCAPTFERYGYFLTSQTLNGWSEAYHEGT